MAGEAPSDRGEFCVIHPGVAPKPPLVLLHGSGQNTDSLMGFGMAVAPGATRIALRGRIAHEQGFAFFRRFPDRSLDVADLEAAALRLWDFLGGLQGLARPVLVGMSNGAITVAAMLVRFGPGRSAGAVLMRPLLPFDDEAVADLSGYPVLVVDGRTDARRAPFDAPLLLAQLARGGARVTRIEQEGGHDLTAMDEALVAAWLAQLPPADKG